MSLVSLPESEGGSILAAHLSDSETKLIKDEKVIKIPPWYQSKRLLVPLFCHLGVYFMYLDRFALSHAQIQMRVEYEWTEPQIGWIQSAFYIGYIPFQLVGAYFARRCGAKSVVLLGILLSSLACVLTPLVAFVYPLMIFMRLLMGFGQGMLYPAMVDILSHWLLPGEKSFWLNFAWSGAQTGTVFVFGSYPSMTLAYGWSFGFYLFSAAGLVWCVLWIFFIYNNPSLHPSLSEEERAALLKYQERSPSNQTSHEYSKKHIPFKKLLLSYQIYVLMFTYFSYNWAFYLLLNNFPTYAKAVLGFKDETLGLASMMPYVCLWISLLGSGLFSDHLSRSGYSTSFVRKLMVCLGFLPTAAIYFFMSFFDNYYGSLIAVCIGVGISGISSSGFAPNSIDLSPEFAGTITSICNVFGSSSGIIVPNIASQILDQANCTATYPQSEVCTSAWNNLFLISACVYVLGAFIWVLFGSTKRLHLASHTRQSFL